MPRVASSRHSVLRRIRRASSSERTAAYVEPTVRSALIEHLSATALVEVLSALLDGPRYTPGPEAAEYQRLSDMDRQSVDLETNALFMRETGIARPLDWRATVDKPLARRWVTLRDVVMGAREQRARHRLYLEKLREAIDKLMAARYGHGVRFGRATDRRRSGKLNYDLANWERIEEVDPAGRADAALRLKSGVLPSVAVDELFSKLDAWAFDCGEFVQVAHLYARRHTLGELFDDARLFEEHAGEFSIVLRPMGSTGLFQRRLFKREAADQPMTRIPGNEVDKRDVDTLLAEAPVGSRITWRRADLPGVTP